MRTSVKILVTIATAAIVGGAVWAGLYISEQEDDFYIYNVGIDISDDDFPNNGHIERFYPYGFDIGHVLPTFEYWMKPAYGDINVYSPCDGKVTHKRYQEDTQDWEIVISAKNNRTWKVIVDHISDIRVNAGDNVSAGQVIGKPGHMIDVMSSTGLSNTPRVEIMVVNERENRTYAPFAVFDPATKTEYEDKITKLMNDLDPTDDFFGQPSMEYPGCYFVSLPGESNFRMPPSNTPYIAIGAAAAAGTAAWVLLWFLSRKGSI